MNFKYLKTLKLIVTSILFITSLHSCSFQSKKYIGIQLYSLREDIKTDLPGTMAKIGQMGYSFIEVGGYDNGKFYDKTPSDFLALVETNGLKLLSSHAGKILPSEEEWEITMEWWKNCIAAHKEVGVSYIILPWLGGKCFENIDMLKETCDYLNIIGEMCNSHGIRFGFHNHDKEFEKIDGEIIYDFLIKNTDPQKVMFEIDLYWIIKGGQDPVEYFKKYPGRFELWHVRDETEVGSSGKINFERIFHEAKISGMKYYIVEIGNYNFTPLESAKKSLDYLLQAEYVK